MKAKSIAFWLSTSIVSLALISGGFAQLLRQRDNVEGIVHLGYPVYFMTLLGAWKIAGGVALLLPRGPRLKEWAYAGAFFELTAAVYSHAAVGDPAARMFWPGFFAALTLVSWALRPASRMLAR